MKPIHGFAVLLFAVILIPPVSAQSDAVKLWPQITPGIYNHANVLAMKCEVAEDGLTVTDAAWDTYQVAGCGKRWTLNMGAPMDVPLKNYKFGPEFSGLPVNLTVEFFNPAKPWEVKENYQEILLLGGKQSIGLPEWFHIPTNRLGYDFDEGDWFPSGWTLPRGKYALWQGAAKARQQDRKGQCPMYDFGFTHVSPCAMTHNGSRRHPRTARTALRRQRVDPPSTAPRTPSPSIRPIRRTGRSSPSTTTPSTAPSSSPTLRPPATTPGRITNTTPLPSSSATCAPAGPDVLIGCWGVGVVKSSFRIFDSIWEGKPTGVVDLTGAKQWREKYNNPAADLHPVFKRCNLNFGNPSVYWINNSKPSQLYAFVQEWEQGKLARPEVPNVLSTWIQVEFVDNYPLSQYRFTDANGKTRHEDLKHQVPASSTYALSLFGHCVMDGLQCWEVGTRYSEELAGLLRLARPRAHRQAHHQRG